MKVIEYQSPKGARITLTPHQVKHLKSTGVWPKDRQGNEYCTVSRGLHRAHPTFTPIEFHKMVENEGRCDV